MKRAAALFFFLFYSVTLSWGLESFGVEVGTGIQWVHNEAYIADDTEEKDPDPLIYRFRIDFPMYFTKSLFFSPGLAFSGKGWQWIEYHRWAMPVDPMNTDLYAISFDLDMPFGYQFNFNSFSAGFYGGPSFRFPIPLWGANQNLRSEMTGYFLSEGRFVHVVGGFVFVIPLAEKMSLTVKGETSLPIHNMWSSGGLPFVDGLTVALTAGVRFTFPANGSQVQ